MARVAVAVEYDGSAYAGWQAQRGAPSIQAVLEAAVGRVADEPLEIVAAGRTDAGVHAIGQVAHFDTRARRSPRGWVLGSNTYLPPDVSLRWARPVPAWFHARYSAEARTYRYLVLNRAARSALAARRATLVFRPLDEARMRAAGATLVGEHDFSAFRSSECQSKSPVRIVESIEIERREEWVSIDVTANAFLHHMVRNIAGLLIAIGGGEAEVHRAGEVLAARDRTRNAPTAPPDGLYLLRVRYPRGFGLPEGSAMIPASSMP